MRPFTKRLSIPVALAALATGTAFAEIELTKEFSISGYIAGSATYQKFDEMGSDNNTDIDAYKLQGVAKFDKISFTGSVFAYGTGDGHGYGYSPILLDAYGTYDFGTGTTVTAGKFLSSLGYEAFDAVNLNQISYANGDFANLLFSEILNGLGQLQEIIHLRPFFGVSIPGYHTGLKVQNQLKDVTLGVAVVDSLFGHSYYKGDGDIDNGLGFEAYAKYTGVQHLTLFAGLGYENKRTNLGKLMGGPDGLQLKSRYLVADFWGEYVWNKTTLGAEFCWTGMTIKNLTNRSIKPDNYFWSVMVKQGFGEKWAATFRISQTALDLDGFMFGVAGTIDTWKYTFAPSYAVTKNLDIVAEYSYTTFDIAFDHVHGDFLGIQTRFKF
jgi:hypothetical protein